MIEGIRVGETFRMKTSFWSEVLETMESRNSREKEKEKVSTFKVASKIKQRTAL